MKKYLLLILASIGAFFSIIYVLPYIISGFNEPIRIKMPNVSYLSYAILIISFFVLKKLTKRYKNTINLHIIFSWVLVLLTYFIIHVIDSYINKNFFLTYSLLDFLGWDFNKYANEFQSRMHGRIFILIPFLYVFYSMIIFLTYRAYKKYKK